MHFSRSAWFEHIKTPTAEPCLIAAGISIYLNWATDDWDNTFPFFISTSKCSLDVLSRTMSGMNLKTWRQTASCNKGAVCETRGEHLVGVGNLAAGDSGGEESDSPSSNVTSKTNSLTDGSLAVEEPPIFITLTEVSELNSCVRRVDIIDLPRELDISETKPCVICCCSMDNTPEKNRKNKESTDV